ncbi:MAG: hypothetical protein ABIM98_01305 [candidate division WOR-3 bacterium]
MMLKVFILLFFLLFTCREKKLGEGEGVKIEYAKIVNPYARKGELLKLDYGVKGNAKVLFEWYINGKKVFSSEEDTFRLKDVAKGDEIYALLIPYLNNTRGVPYKTKSIKVENSPPIVESAKLEPENIYSNTEKVRIVPSGYDPDGDPISFIVRWRINRNFPRDSSLEFHLKNIKAGDTIEALVYARDNKIRSNKAYTIQTVVLNSSPDIKGQDIKYKEGKIYIRFIGEDKDNDKLTLNLLHADPAPLIVKEDSLLTIFSYAENLEKINMKVRVMDEAGNYVEKVFSFNIKRKM